MNSNVVELETNRLKLRQWRESDFQPFAIMNADPDVMKYYPNPLSTSESDAMANKIKRLISERSWGFWAVETISKGEFIGFVGLHIPTYELPVAPCVEVGWRLDKKYWGRGYATEAANEALRFAFQNLELNKVYSFASVSNKKSWKVMERLGMVNTGNNFEHPVIPEGHVLREHVLYSITRDQWKEITI